MSRNSCTPNFIPWTTGLKQIYACAGNKCATAPVYRDEAQRNESSTAEGWHKGNKMSEAKKDELLHDHNRDGVDRRGSLKCMAWAGTGAFCVIKGGILRSYSLSRLSELHTLDTKGELSFVQISDSHMGFNRPANPDVIGTLRAAVDKINGLSTAPQFMLHTGDITHLSKPEEFDTVDQILKGARTKDVFYVPGEHDVLNDDGKQFLERYGKSGRGTGWYSFNKKGVHFIGLVNVMNLKAGGLGTLGNDQLEWLEDDVKPLKSSTPHRRVCGHSAVVCISGMGLGNSGQRSGAGVPEESRLRDGSERAYSPDDAEDRRQCNVPHGCINRISPAAAGQGGFAGSHEGARRTTAQRFGYYRRELRSGSTRVGRRGLDAGMTKKAF